jgi:Leucine-rich repeat (LRR) protein
MAIPLIKLMPNRRWTQVSLRAMFVAVALLCVILSLWVVPAERQRRTAAAIQDMGGAVDYVPFLSLIEDSGVSDPRESEAFPKTFLRRWLPPDYFDEVLIVLLQNTRLTDAKLVHLQGLTSLESLGLDNTQNTDAGLAHLQGRTGLQFLSLGRSQVTDAGLAHLQSLTNLRNLSLGGTQVTDAGLAHLQGLKNLKMLGLNRTQITDAGLTHLQGLMNLEALGLDNTQVTDAGLVYLQGLTNLKTLDLTQTQVTDAGVSKLRQALPKCKIFGP